MDERTFLQQLFLLRQDIESCPMLDPHAATQRERWAARLGDLLNRRNAAIEPPKLEHQWRFYMNGSFCERCGAAIGSGVPCR